MSPHAHSLRHSQWPAKITVACLTLLMIGSALQAMDPGFTNPGQLGTGHPACASKLGERSREDTRRTPGAAVGYGAREKIPSDDVEKILGEWLLEAAEEGNELKIKELMLVNVPINYANEKGATALILAAQNGHLGVVKILLAHGANVNARATGSMNQSALSTAADKGHDEIVQLLLDHGAAVDLPIANGATPLLIAAENDRLNIVQNLLKHGANVNAQVRLENISALMQAAEFGHSSIVKLLLTAISNADAAVMRNSSCALLGSIGQRGMNAPRDMRIHLTQHLIHALVQERMKRVPAMAALQDINGDTAQNIALKYGNAEIANLLDQNNPESQKAIRTLIEANVREALRMPRPEPMEEESGGWLCTVQ